MTAATRDQLDGLRRGIPLAVCVVCNEPTADPHYPAPENGDPTTCDACCPVCRATKDAEQ